MRDFQRQKVYDSERIFRTKHKSKIKYYKNLKEIQGFIDIVLKDKHFKKYGITNIHVYCSKRTVAYGWLENNISIAMKLPKWAKNQLTILHEISHGICHKLFPNEDISPHGIEFIYVYLDLIYNILGKRCFKIICKIFTENKVKHSFSI